MSEFFSRIYDTVFVFQLFSISLSLVILFFPKRKIDLKGIIWGAINCGIIFGCGTLLQASCFALFSLYRPLTTLSFIFAYFLLTVIVFIVTKENARAKGIMLLSFLTSTVIITEFAAQLMRLLLFTYQKSFDWIEIVTYIFIILFSVLMRHLSICHFSNTTRFVGALSLLNNIICISIIGVYLIYSSTEGIRTASYFVLFTIFALYLISSATYLLTFFLSKEREAVVELSAEMVALDSDKEMMRISQQTYADIRAIRHDIKNQYALMSLLLKEQKYEQLEKYFEDLGNTLAFSLYRIDCGNEKINAVLNMEIAKARSMEINVNTNLIVPKFLPFHGSDLCGLIANGIDNAIEYLHHSTIEKKEVNVDIHPQGEFLYIGIVNEVVGLEDTDNPSLETKKKDNEFHGIGHRIIEKISKKYNGYVNYSIANSKFILEIMLDLNCKKK